MLTDRYADFQNSYHIGGHVLLGLRGGWNTPHYRLFIEASNLLDKDYVTTHAVRDFATADADILNPGMPRAVFAGLELQF